jgi:hypothetical protein
MKMPIAPRFQALAIRVGKRVFWDNRRVPFVFACCGEQSRFLILRG